MNAGACVMVTSVKTRRHKVRIGYNCEMNEMCYLTYILVRYFYVAMTIFDYEINLVTLIVFNLLFLDLQELTVSKSVLSSYKC